MAIQKGLMRRNPGGRFAGLEELTDTQAAFALAYARNGFTCLPDNPNFPGPDPMCGDANAMEWAQAWIGRRAPPEGAGADFRRGAPGMPARDAWAAQERVFSPGR
jgi:hypothetical protein